MSDDRMPLFTDPLLVTDPLLGADPLPGPVDIRRLIAAGTSINAREPLANFGRLRDMLEADDGHVDIELVFFVDEQGLRRIDGRVQTTVSVLCQRCLSPMPLPVDSAFGVVAVWSEERALHVPRHLDPYVVGEEPEDLRTLIEDELIISLPFVSYHERQDCYIDSEAPQDAAEQYEAEADRRDNPFKVLGRLKSGH